MALFLSTYVNKLDKKGRISVPSGFRAALAGQSFQGVVLFKSQKHAALEGFPMSYMEDISERLDHFDLFSDEQDDLATTIFAQSVQLPLDGDGRIILPSDLIDFAGLGEQASFVGLGHKFQIWAPEKLEARKVEAMSAVKDKNMTIPKNNKADKGKA